VTSVWCVFLLVPVLSFPAFAAALRVDIRDSEVWLIGAGHERQITDDGNRKHGARLSPSAKRIAYVQQCDPQRRDCNAGIVVVDTEGSRIRSFPPSEHCGGAFWVAWTAEDRLAAVCHINPSLNAYIETDIRTGKTIRDLLGYGFTPSPDGSLVAYVGWIPHFAPPYAQSNYLQVERRTVYPLPPGVSPIEREGLVEPPPVVRVDGPTYRGIHQFLPGLSWSPDSRWIALIDCTYDWTPGKPGSLSRTDGEESERSCNVAVVSTGGQSALFPLAEARGELREATLAWTSARSLRLDVNGGTRDFVLP